MGLLPTHCGQPPPHESHDNDANYQEIGSVAGVNHTTNGQTWYIMASSTFFFPRKKTKDNYCVVIHFIPRAVYILDRPNGQILSRPQKSK